MLDLIIISILALWRLSNLISNERGPFAVFVTIREFLGIQHDDDGNKIGYIENKNKFAFELAQAIDCVWCLSLWLGIALTPLLYFIPIIKWGLLPFALSAGVIIIESIVNGTEDVVTYQQDYVDVSVPRVVNNG